MNNIFYKITTPYGNCYQLDSSGNVIKYSNGLDKTNSTSSDIQTWRVLGIVELLPFGRLGNLIPLPQAVNIKNFSFKNGKPKYTVVDLDHGTERIVGNTKYHGVSKVFLA